MDAPDVTDDGVWRKADGPCRNCGTVGQLDVRALTDDSGAYDDVAYRCRACHTARVEESADY